MKKIFALTILITSLVLLSNTAMAKSKKYYYEPSTAEEYYKLGQDYEWKNNRPGAADIYTKALELNPNYDPARIARAKVNYFYQRYDKALEDYNYFYNKPNYGAQAFHEFRIDCKKQLGMYDEAMDDMFEVILAYGGQTRILEDMRKFAVSHPELLYKLNPEAHRGLLVKYSTKAPELRGYAKQYQRDKNNKLSQEYYKYYYYIATRMDELVPTNTPNALTNAYRMSNFGANDIINGVE